MQAQHRSMSLPSKSSKDPSIPHVSFPHTTRTICLTPQPFSQTHNPRPAPHDKGSKAASTISQQQLKFHSYSKIQVYSISDVSSKERLRLKIAEQQNQFRLKVNWSALQWRKLFFDIQKMDMEFIISKNWFHNLPILSLYLFVLFLSLL